MGGEALFDLDLVLVVDDFIVLLALFVELEGGSGSAAFIRRSPDEKKKNYYELAMNKKRNNRQISRAKESPVKAKNRVLTSTVLRAMDKSLRL